jgi:hypothetical protein
MKDESEAGDAVYDDADTMRAWLIYWFDRGIGGKHQEKASRQQGNWQGCRG